MGVHDNWTFVDILYREFYTGSDTDLTKEERAILESLFSTKYYVNLEQEYGHMTMMGEKNASKVLPQEYKEWEKYLNKYRDLIVTGTHFTTFATIQYFRCNCYSKLGSSLSSFLCSLDLAKVTAAPMTTFPSKKSLGENADHNHQN